MELIVTRARAYVYAGDWVADCPRECGNVEHLYARSNPRDPNSPRIVQLSGFACSYCGMTASVEWPHNMPDLMEVLMKRPIPHTRNWYPKGHTTALKFRLPDGQSPRDLIDESAEHGVM